MGKNKTFTDLHIYEFLRIMGFMKKRIWLYLVGLLFGCGTFSFYQISVAFINRGLVNSVLNKDIHGLMNVVILLSIALLCLSTIFPFFIYVKQYSMKNTVIEIRADLFKHIESLPLAYFESQHSGDLISRVTNDVNIFESLYDWQLHSLLLSTMWGIGALISMLLLDWRLSLLMITLGIISTFVNFTFTKPIRKFSNKIQETFSLLTQNFGDILTGFRILKMFDIRNIIVNKFNNENNTLAQETIGRVRKTAQLNSINYFLNLLSLVGVFIVGSFMSASGTIDFGTVLAIITLQSGVSFMFSNFGYFFSDIQTSLAGAERVIEFLNQEVEPERYNNLFNSDLDYATDKNNTIVFENVTFSYEKRENVLNGLSITVGKDKIVALVGPSGGGKSTVVKLLLGFYPPESGKIEINGKPLHKYTLEGLRTLMAYVPQDAYLFDGTIEENIRYGRLDATKDEIIAAAKDANAHDFIMEAPDGYDSKVGERGVRLSGGQKQRLAIARALLKNAPILLLDEATSALDSESEQLVQQALNKLMKGRTTIAIAHRLSTIENADMIYVIDGGIVTERGTHADLVKESGLYNYLYELGNLESKE